MFSVRYDLKFFILFKKFPVFNVLMLSEDAKRDMVYVETKFSK
jgi:hypothetical protein